MDDLARLAPDGFSLSAEGWEELVSLYEEPHRRYHDISHLLHLGMWFKEVEQGPGWEDSGSVFGALLYHDAVYDPVRRDNEEKSAALAVQRLPPDLRERAGAIIRATASHGRARPGSLDSDTCHFLDADCAILGSEKGAYDAYECGVRAEYVPVVGEDVFMAGRRHFLEALLVGPIFITPFFERRLGKQARINVTQALRSLGPESKWGS